MMKKPALTTFLICVIVAIQTAISCSPTADNEAKLRRERLRQFDDSITSLVPSVLDSINSAITQTQQTLARKQADNTITSSDSLSLQEYRMCLARYYWLSDHPEKADTIVQDIVNFVRRQDGGYYDKHKVCSTERLNALMANALQLQAARNHNFHREPKQTLDMYTESYRLLLHSDVKEALPKACANLADAYIQVNDIPGAAKWYRRALFLVDSLGLPEKENITLYMGLAQIYLSLHDFHSAQIYYNETERYFRLMSPQMQAYHINNLGNFYYYTKDYAKALATFKRMERLLIDRGMANKFDMYLCRVNLADVYFNLGRLAEARHCLQLSEPYFRKNGDATALYYCNTIHIGIAAREGNAAEVERVLRSEHLTHEMPYAMVNIRNQYLRRYYEQKGNYRQAYANLQANISYDDSLEHNRSNMRSAEIMARFTADTLQLHHDLALEHKNAMIQTANMKTTAAVSVAVVLLLLLVMWMMYIRKKQLQDQVNIMNLKLNNVRNRISPHFMFNVLNNKILKSGKEEASELMELARLIRTNLDMSSQPFMYLNRELEFVEQYIKVERYLLGDDFYFCINTSQDVDTAKVRIPAMFLQILTENAIVHGLKGQDGHKELHISISRQQDVTIIRVSDNGPGFDARRALKNGTGLGIISQTIAVTNEHNKHKMRFEIKNREDDKGNVVGCEATLKVPDNIKF